MPLKTRQITEDDIRSMKANFDAVHDLDLNSIAIKRLRKVLSQYNDAALDKIVAGNIRWVSPVAKSIRTGETLSLTLGPVQDQGRGFLK